MTDEPAEPGGPDEREDGGYLGALGKVGGAGRDQGQADALAALGVLSVELGETRAHLAELRSHFGDHLEEYRKLGRRVDSLAALGAQVTALADQVAELLKAPDDGPTTRPLDLAHIAREDRERVLSDLVQWVREVVFRGWPWTQQSLPWCWLQHPDLINGVLWLRATYAAAYEDPAAKPHHAADWNRWLEEVMRQAERRTEGCPADVSAELHMVPLPPRDDSVGVARLAKRETLAMMHQLMAIQNSDLSTIEDRDRARERIMQILEETGVTQAEYEQYAKALRATVDAEREAKRTRRDAKRAQQAPPRTQRR